MELVTNNHADLVVAAHLIGDDTIANAPYDGLVVSLFQTDLTLTRQTTLAELEAEVCDYPGYSDDTITWNGASIADDGNVEVVGILGEFRPTSDSAPNVAYGLYATFEGDSSLAFCCKFDEPVPMGTTFDALIPTIRLRSPTGGSVSLVS